jgi:hypothetical protein
MDSHRTISNHTRSLFLWICTIVSLTGGRIFSADQKNNSNAATTVRKSSAPYCGLYCIYTVRKIAGQDIQL